MKSLIQLVNQHGLAKVIEVVQLKNYQAERVVSVLSKYQVQLAKLRDEKIPVDRDLEKQRFRLQKRINGVLYVFGAVVERDIGTYFLETDIILHHGPIQAEAQKTLQTAVLSIWSPRFSFKEKAEYLGFRFSATYVYIAARYIIGEAAFAVGRFDIALLLHESLENELGTLAGHPNLKVIKDRLNQLIVEEHTIIAFLSYSNEGDLDKAAFHNAQSLKYHPNNYDSLLLRSVLEVVRERNLTKALQTAYQAKSVAGKNGTWRYSVGFLLLNMGKTQKALEIYKQIETRRYEGEESTLDQVFHFDHDILKEDPYNVESLFIIGFLEYKKRGNYPQAHVYLSRAIESGSDHSRYDLLVKNAQEYLSEVENLMADYRS